MIGRFFIILSILFLHISCASAQSSYQDIPNFRMILERLTKNQKEYNLYNDSIFLIHDHDEWTEFFFRRSQKNKEIYKDNEKYLNLLFNYFEKPTHPVPNNAYDSLYVACASYLGRNLADPFIAKRISSILLDHYKDLPGNQNRSMRPSIWLGEAYYNIFQMTKDKEILAKSYELIKYAADSTHIHTLEDVGLYGYALNNLSIPNWYVNKQQTLDEFKSICSQLRNLANNPILQKIHIPQNTINKWKQQALQEDENIVRNFYLPNENAIDKTWGDSVLHEVINRMEKDRTLSSNSQMRLLIMKIKTGDIKASEAIQKMLAIYNKEKQRKSNEKFDDISLNEYMQLFTNMTYVNDIADIPERQKHKNALFFCNEIVNVYQKRRDQQGSTYYIKCFILYTTYPRLLSHLTDDERTNYLQQMIVNTQVTTYAHSMHVAKLAQTLAEGIVAHNPKMFVGYFGLKKKEYVEKNKEQIKVFMRRAALLHDMGKNDIASVVCNNYRPLFDEEREIIRLHPKLGLKYLATTQALAPYYDITLGHHKWYNGKGGYPEKFDNTKSPKRFLIDIITLCDCMQAATEKLGRNYKEDKSFETVMAELKEGAGTRYNPDLVKLIETNEDVKASLKEVVIDGWLDVYYDIHKRFFK